MWSQCLNVMNRRTDNLPWQYRFVNLDSLISRDGGSETEILRRIGIARDCFFLLDKNIWRSHIHTETKVQLYRTYILPVLFYGCETWTVTRTLERRLDAFDTWCLRKILRTNSVHQAHYQRDSPEYHRVLASFRWRSPSAWGSLDTWLARPLRKITTVSSPLL